MKESRKHIALVSIVVLLLGFSFALKHRVISIRQSEGIATCIQLPVLEHHVKTPIKHNLEAYIFVDCVQEEDGSISLEKKNLQCIFCIILGISDLSFLSLNLKKAILYKRTRFSRVISVPLYILYHSSRIPSAV